VGNGLAAMAERTWSSIKEGKVATFQEDNSRLVDPNSFAIVLHSTQFSMCAETDWVRSRESSPSRKAMISSGAKGCVVELMRALLSG
jgi:hypothetical protein